MDPIQISELETNEEAKLIAARESKNRKQLDQTLINQLKQSTQEYDIDMLNSMPTREYL